MRHKIKPPEQERFETALRTVLRVSHSELKTVMDAEKKAKKRNRAKHGSASRDSGEGR